MTTESAILTSRFIPNAADLPVGEWSCISTQPGSVQHPRELEACGSNAFPAIVPGTVAGTLHAAGKWSHEHPPEIDTQDWWYRTTIDVSSLVETDERQFLCFDGLASLTEVWLNGERILTTENMFRRYRVNVSELLGPTNELAICFRSLIAALQKKRPRPRWKTNLVNHQQLRWIRTSLQGRIPGWSPPTPPIGPWGKIRLQQFGLLEDLQIQTALEGPTGTVQLSGQVLTSRANLTGELRIGDQTAALQVTSFEEGFRIRAELEIPDVELWWPQTHGRPALYNCEIRCLLDGEELVFHRSPVGFRQVRFGTDRGFSVRVNGEPIFCRGACWTLSDSFNFHADEEALRRDLTLARDAGVNMLRVGGTMVYESDRFYELCDELGILVWQDFMFANMDYPVEDPQFQTEIVAEVSEQLQRLSAHPSVVVYCGGSEIEQQAAMLGIPKDQWRNKWFGEELPELCRRYHPEAAYLPSTPTGGVLPFQPERGVTHYYGVGAYLRPLTDVRRADVQFTSECLGFSNVPEPATVDAIMQGGRAVTHDPRWKARVPRDTGAGWDFEDVRDHYFREIYGIDPVQCRSWDPVRYLQLSRTVPGEILTSAYAEWRSTHTNNQGALVWFYKDLWPAAGWGIVDCFGNPKSTYYYLKRCWQSRQLTVTDEGLNGLHLHLTNETNVACRGTVEVLLLKEPGRVVVRQQAPVEIAPRGKIRSSADEILGGFYDVSYAYRFGPPHHDVAIATWYDEERNIVSQAYHFIGNRIVQPIPGGVETQTVKRSDEEYQVTIRAERFLHAVRVSAKGYLPTDNYFHLPPHQDHIVRFRTQEQSAPFRGEIEALNLELTGISSPAKTE